MTPKISLATAVAGAALMLAVPAWGSPAVPPDAFERAVAQNDASTWQQALTVRSEALNRSHGLGDYAPSTASTSSFEQALTLRGEAMNRRYELGAFATTSTYQDAHERAYRVGGVQFTTSNSPDAFGRAVAARGSSGVISGDDHVRIDPANLPTTVPTSSPSGREVEWPQIGIGFGIGILLALGLVFALRMTRIRPLAH